MLLTWLCLSRSHAQSTHQEVKVGEDPNQQVTMSVVAVLLQRCQTSAWRKKTCVKSFFQTLLFHNCFFACFLLRYQSYQARLPVFSSKRAASFRLLYNFWIFTSLSVLINKFKSRINCELICIWHLVLARNQPLII